MRAHTKMEARIIERMGGPNRTRETASVLMMERKWATHLLTGGTDTEEERRAVNCDRSAHPHWFEQWTTTTGAGQLRRVRQMVARVTEHLAMQKALPALDPANVAALEQEIAEASIAAAHLAAELWVLSVTRLPEADTAA